MKKKHYIIGAIVLIAIIILLVLLLDKNTAGEIFPGTQCTENSQCKYLKCVLPEGDSNQYGEYTCANVVKTNESWGCEEILIDDSVDCGCNYVGTTVGQLSPGQSPLYICGKI